MKNTKICQNNFIKIITIFGKVILIWKRVNFLQNRKMWEMAASYKDKIWQKNHLTSKQILNIEVHTCFISKHVSMCWFLNSSRFSVKLQMIFNLFPPPFIEKIPPLEVRHALWMAPNDSGKLWTRDSRSLGIGDCIVVKTISIGWLSHSIKKHFFSGNRILHIQILLQF